MASIRLQIECLTAFLLVMLWVSGANATTLLDDALIYVAPIEAAPPPMNQSIANLVAEESTRNGVQIEATQSVAPYHLVGVASATALDAGTNVMVVWELKGANKNTVFEFIVEEMAPYQSPDAPWDAVDRESLQRLARQTADQLVVELDKKTVGTAVLAAKTNDASGQTESSSKPAFAKVTIGDIVGAPSDGNSLLPMALSQILQQVDVETVGTSAPDVYTITARVTVSEPTLKQTVGITWQVSGPNGQEYAQIEQSNEIEAGALDETWGDAAVFAAAAAGEGIFALIERLGPTPPK